MRYSKPAKIIQASGNIGRRVALRFGKEILEATIIDTDYEGRAKRVRVQSQGNHQGKVLFPHQYTIIEYLT